MLRSEPTNIAGPNRPCAQVERSMLHLYQRRNRAKIPAATKSRNRITPIIRSRRARSSCPGLGIEIPMKETNIQKRERWGSDDGFSGFGPEAAGFLSLSITKRVFLGI